jgi:purine-binding chemotaxis protein CheW
MNNVASGMDGRLSAILVVAGSQICAVPLVNVIEVFRPLPIQPMPTLPSFVLGLSLIRGNPTPVVQLSSLIEAKRPQKNRRFVLLRIDPRPIALAVEEVLKICDLELSQFIALPQLLHDPRSEATSMIGRMDQQLLVLLQATRFISQEIWEELEIGQKEGTL